MVYIDYVINLKSFTWINNTDALSLDLIQDLRVSHLSTSDNNYFNDITIQYGTLRMLLIDSHLTNLSSVTVYSNKIKQSNENITFNV